jgi:hypothetical protein
LGQGEVLAKDGNEVTAREIGDTHAIKIEISGGFEKNSEVGEKSVDPSKDEEASFNGLLAISAKETEFV